MDLQQLEQWATSLNQPPADLASLMPELAVLAGVEQDGRWHQEGDVLTHTRLTVAALTTLSAWRALPAERRLVLLLAAALHDLGKATSTEILADGSITSHGHSRRGAVAARSLLWRAGLDFARREAVCRLIANHQVLFHLYTPGAQGADWQLRRLSWEVELEELVILGTADELGRLPALPEESQLALYLARERATELGCLQKPYPFPTAASRVQYLRSRGASDPDYPRRTPEGARVVLLAGLPAAGKDYYARTALAGLECLSYDGARLELGLKHGKHDGAATQAVLGRARELLRTKTPFVWNATHLSREMRTKALELLYAYAAQVELVYLEESPAELARRNAARTASLPAAATERLEAKWEVPKEHEAHQVRYLVAGREQGVLPGEISAPALDGGRCQLL